MKAHIGLSGWSYKEWKEDFYEGIKQSQWLQHYAAEFDTVEVNSSFYHMPKPQTVKNWAEKVHDGFIFCPKISRYITHLKKLNDCEDAVAYFFEVFEAMKEKMGPVLIQLPPSLGFDRERIAVFFSLLSSRYSGYDFVLEARHGTWLDDKAFALMKEHNIGWVISQSGVGFPYAEEVTSKHVYIRFHGPGKLYASGYSEKQLQEYRSKFTNWAKGRHEIWAYFNNTAEEHAIHDARMLKQLAEE